ncbi:alpha/beta fold hydrolase [Micromonospora sp. DT233]|uniref:alpha/beta fold hydrolase n=1 Tax=Micromonospora sp. DT233 TaxID=3393432 RepID=UPI003CF15040
MNLQEFQRHKKTVDTASGPIGYADVGEGPVAFFVHGLGTNGYLWRRVIGELRHERRCIAIDLPGHGSSPAGETQDLSLSALADTIEHFLDALELTGVDLVANDTGAAISQIFVSRHPERLTSLTLTNCEAHDNIPNEAFKGTVELARRGELAPIAQNMIVDIETARSGDRAIGLNYEFPDLLTDETLRTYLEPVCGTLAAARAFERLLSSLDSKDLLGAEPGLRALTAPTLIVWGTGDFHFEVSWAYWLRDLIPGASEVVEIEGGKLYFPDERADEFLPHLRRHWAAARRDTVPAR